MKKVCIVTNQGKDLSMRVTKELTMLLSSYGISYIPLIDRKLDDGGYLYVDREKLPDDIEAVIVLGGDGTMLGAARDVYGMNIPLLGVNVGTLGYLAEVEVHKMKYAVEQLAQDRYTLENRMMLSAVIKYTSDKNEDNDVALNDIVISRIGPPQLISIKLFVNGRKLHTYEADGLVISTPTGSTAYNLSAGGPIVEPTASMIVITPICSHELSLRSIVLSGDDLVVAEIGKSRQGGEKEASVSFDGKTLFPLKTGDRISIGKAAGSTCLMNLNEMSFLETLRRKMK